MLARLRDFAASLVTAKPQQDFVDTEATHSYPLATAFTQPTPSTDISGFTAPPAGPFRGQEKEFKRQGIGMLDKKAQALVMRGDARDIDWLLTHGVQPKAPNAPVHVEAHRSSSSNSGGVSFTTCTSVAVASGSNSSQSQQYGSVPLRGDNSFYLIAALLDGSKHFAAGPGKIKQQEHEATLGGPLDPVDILGYRRCVLNPHTRVAVCSNIYTRSYLSTQRRLAVLEVLSGTNKPAHKK